MAAPPHPRFCACCEAPGPGTPLEIRNRPGLSALGHRIGTFASFRAAMLQDIAGQAELAGLATRESDDYAVTVIELFAAVGDVLAFYNERIANERYLRTARERDSVRRLVRLIGYRLRPGLAAETLLAFTLDEGARTRIRKGLKVMSVPAQDERAQVFETLEAIQADARLNALPVHAPWRPFNAFHRGRGEAPVVTRPEPLSQGDQILVFGLSGVEQKSVQALEQARDGERMRFAPAVQAPGLWPGIARAVKLVRRLRFFGHNAPDTHPHYDPDSAIPPQSRWRTLTLQLELDAGASSYPLDARYEDLKPGAQLVLDAGAGADPRLRTAVVTETEDAPARITGKADPGDAAETPVPVPGLADTVTHVRLAQTIRGRPAVIAAAGLTHHLARSGGGHVLTRTGVDTRWQSLGDLVASEALSVVPFGPAGVDVYARDALGRLQRASWSAGAWAAWADLGGILTSRPAALAVAGPQVLVFARGLDSGLWVIRLTAAALVDWAPLGGVLTSAPAPVSWGGARADVFARGGDRGLWRIAWDGAQWSAWEPLGGTLASAPAAASSAPGRLDVVALDDQGALVHRRWAGGEWSEWQSPGGSAKGEPVVVATGPDRVDVLVRGADDGLWHIARTGESWGAWTALGGTLSSPPAVARSGAQLLVSARDAEGVLIARAWTGAGWTDWERLDGGLGAVADRRQARLYEVATPDIGFREYDYPRSVEGGRVCARLADAPGLEGLDKGRRIFLDDGATRHSARVTASRTAASTPGAAPDHLLVDFTPGLPAALATATLRGNVARASHGESQPEEPLGNGDAGRAFSRFRLRRSPLTYLQSALGVAGDAELEVRVNGELWREVPSLYGRGPVERVYTARQSDAGESEITFGDGRTGARVPTGAMNVIARYRTGVGLEGRMQAEQLSIPLERPVGLRAVTNPEAADGGADPETRDDARAAAPATVRTFGRAVSLRDFEALATASGLASRAHATWVWQALQKTVHLTVGAAGGAALSPDALRTLHAALTAARDPNRPLLLANLVRVPLVVRARLLRDAALEADAVREAARAALAGHFAFELMPLGRAVHASDVYAVLQGARGVVAVHLDVFHLKGHAELTAEERALRAVSADPVQAHVRIFAARPAPADATLIDRFARAGFAGSVAPPVLAAEQAYLEDPAADLELSVVEAL